MALGNQDRARRGLPSDRKVRLLRELFGEVCDQQDWKAPIRAVVPTDMAPLYIEAIAFMTATECVVVSQDNGDTTIESVGYRTGPAGDR